MDIVPDTVRLSQVMVQATAPAFILGAVAGFGSILLGRMTSVIDRIRGLNKIADGDAARAHLKFRFGQEVRIGLSEGGHYR
jgi:hypothetical protein